MDLILNFSLYRPNLLFKTSESYLKPIGWGTHTKGGSEGGGEAPKVRRLDRVTGVQESPCIRKEGSKDTNKLGLSCAKLSTAWVSYSLANSLS